MRLTRITRFGLPRKYGRINMMVSPVEKAEVKKAAIRRRQTITDYLLSLHRAHTETP